MRHLFSTLLFLFLFTPYYVNAKELELGNVKGSVVDGKSKEALGFVTISVFDKSGKNVVKAGMSDNNGTFDISDIRLGTYMLRVTFLGYQTLNLPFSLSKDKPDISLGSLGLSEVPNQLQEVTVTGQRAQMRLDIDKKVFDVDQSIAATGGSATDVLENVPSVSVDNEGNVSLRSSESVTIFINGRPSGLNSDNQAQILQQMPAESIQSIEIITNPSAKYSPEGSAGIINIVLKEDRKAGYFGSVQAGVDTDGGYRASANINLNSGKWDSYANIGLRRMKMERGGFSNRINNPDTPDQSYLNQTTDGNNEGYGLFLRAGTTYHFAKNDYLGLSGFGMLGSRDQYTGINYIGTTDLSTVTDWTGYRKSDSNNDNKGMSLTLDYQHDFGKDHNLKSSISYNIWNMDGTTDYDQRTDSVFPSKTVLSYQSQLSNRDSKNFEAQIDYTNKLSENTKIEAGYKGDLDDNKSPTETWNDPEHLVIIESLYNDFTYKSNIQALYATFSSRINKSFGYQLGLRGEYTHINTESIDYYNNNDQYKDSYFDLFPSAFLTYTLPKNNELQVNYTRRINRPRGRELNSFKNITDVTRITMGNPKLNPVYTNAYEFTYLKNLDYHTFSTTAYYRTNKGVIQNVSYMMDGTMYSQPINISESQSLGVELLAKDRFFNILDLTTTVNLYYYKLNESQFTPIGSSTSIDVRGQEDFSWDARMIANLMLKSGLSFQITGNYNAAQAIAQGTMDASYSLDAGLRKSFFNRKLSVALTARDLLDSRKRTTHTSGEGFSQDAENWFGGRKFNLTLTYNFGNMTNKNKKQQRQDNNNNGGEEDMNGGMDM